MGNRNSEKSHGAVDGLPIALSFNDRRRPSSLAPALRVPCPKL
jgi:hypothetical protein